MNGRYKTTIWNIWSVTVAGKIVFETESDLTNVMMRSWSASKNWETMKTGMVLNWDVRLTVVLSGSVTHIFPIVTKWLQCKDPLQLETDWWK